METHESFIFESYSFDRVSGKVELHYSLDGGVHFIETLLLPPEKIAGDYSEEAVDQALFALHLIGGISYYKTCIPKTIEIRSGTLTEAQATFWNDVYENGLGEFFFRNNIDFRDLIHFPFSEKKEALPPSLPDSSKGEGVRGKGKRVLIPIGGGKDSVVTAELAKKGGLNATLFRMGHHPFIAALANEMNLPLLTVDRHLSPVLFALNENGALNGHVPITMYLSFVTVLVSLLCDFDAVMMSNERSASEGNVEFHGKQINHQWSKSLEAEKSLQEYVRHFISPDLDYFSLLRPLSELHIAKLFTDMPQYLGKTTSCNTNWRILSSTPAYRQAGPNPSSGGGGGQRWCCVCPKCAFVFTLYAAFLPKEKVVEVFGKDLFAEVSLAPLYRELLGQEGQKPFECVGTPEETKAALLLAQKRGDFFDSRLMEVFTSEILPHEENAEALITDAMTPSDEHVIPQEFQKLLPS